MTQFYSEKKDVFGSFLEIFLPENYFKTDILDKCFQEAQRIQNKYSRFDDNSYLNKLNSNLNKWQDIDKETLVLIKKSLEIQKKTNGYFDITINETLENLGYDKNYTFKGKKNYLMKKKIINLVHSFLPKIKIDEINLKLYLRKKIDFGGFGKGYALDNIYTILNSNNIKDFLINAGGDIRCKSTTKDWISYLAHPVDKTKIIGEIKINNLTLVGSAPTYRHWGENNEFHHLINPKNNKSQNEVKCIFILGDEGLYLDSMSTALFVSGYKNAISFSKKLNLNILIISNKNEIYKSYNFNAILYD